MLVRYFNIDAVSRWLFDALPIDGLQRLLLYQPQHQIGYALSCTALIVMVQQVRAPSVPAALLAGVFLASVPIDIDVSDTYFVVAHIHYVLFGGSVFTIFAGIYYWFPKMTGRMFDDRLGKLHFWLTFVAFNATFFPMHWVGLDGMPRRVADYAGTYGAINMVISIFSFVLGASVVIFVYNIVTSWARGPIAGSNPWKAMTIEWQVSSPPPVFNFDEIPQVVGSPYEYGVPGAKHVVLKGGALQEAPT